MNGNTKPLLQLLFAMLVSLGTCAQATNELNIPLASGDEIVAAQFPADGKFLMLWFAPEYGFRDAHRALAQKISEQNIEVWLSNIQESLFMPNSSNSIKQLDGSHVAELIELAHQQSGKKIVLAGDSYASIVALRGAHQWQQKPHTENYLTGAVLFSPYTYASIPPLGQLPEYLPVISATTIPVMIYQANHSAIISQFSTLREKLQQNGSPVYTRFTSNIMSLFYEKEPTPAMISEASVLPGHIRQMLTVLDKHPPATKPAALQHTQETKSGIDVYLREIQGEVSPLPIALKNLHGNYFNKLDYSGKVTLINFWATWCPPCIEEIPSLNRLKNKMHGLPFELISINYAEDPQAIHQFMKRIHIDFPVLLDPDGEFAKQWNIISYPSTFVVGTDGKVRYGVNAAIEWDNPELIEKLKSMM